MFFTFLYRKFTKCLKPFHEIILLQLVAIEIVYWEHISSVFLINVYAIIAYVLPWLIIPGYVIYCMTKAMGPIKIRFARCCHPNDWYPVEAEHREEYEKAIGNAEINHTLSEVKEEVN